MWQPSHIGISGNQNADKAAKSALNKPILQIPIPYTDFKLIINEYIHDKWQQTWNSQTQNKLGSKRNATGQKATNESVQLVVRVILIFTDRE